MFCPSCQADYRNAFRRCLVCGERLVDQLPVTHSVGADLIPIPGLNEADIGLVESLLQSRDLWFYVIEGMGETPSLIAVRCSDLPRVKACLKEFRTRGNGGSLAPIPW